jgi:hypothetical protein
MSRIAIDSERSSDMPTAELLTLASPGSVRRQRSQLLHGEPSAEDLSSLALVTGVGGEISTGDGTAEGSSNLNVPPRPSNVAERGPTARSFQLQAVSPT